MKWIVLTTILLFSAILFGPVQGATVTLGNNVIVSNAYGKLTASRDMQTDMFATYTNGTIYFDVRNTNSIQALYTFTAQAYGNGTFTVRFKGPLPFSVQTGGHQIAYNYVLTQQDVQYAGGDPGYGGTGALVVSYRGPSYLLRDAAMVMALLTPIVITIGLAKWSENPLDPNRPEKMRRLYYAGLIMSLGTATLFILSQLFT